MARPRSRFYASREAFERDRKLMWERGWLVVDERVVPVVKPDYVDGGSEAGCLFLPLIWLWRRGLPDTEIVVTYERARD